MDTAPVRRWTFREVMVLSAVALLLIAALVVVVRQRREAAVRVACADKLKQIGLALLLYSNENRGAAPRVRYQVAKVVTPVWGTGATSSDPFSGPEPHDVTAAIFLLLRTQDITADVFVCPSTNAVPDTCGGAGVGRPSTAQNRANFTDVGKNLSYSMQNPYIDDWARLANYRYLGSISSEFAVAADMNPGTAGGDDDVTKPNATSSAALMKRANSNNHGGAGQNVLYSDGHVEFRTTPFAGVKGDNIFTNQLGSVVASPRREFEDSILLPTDD